MSRMPWPTSLVSIWPGRVHMAFCFSFVHSHGHQIYSNSLICGRKREVGALFLVERRCKNTLWPNEGYFELFRGAATSLEPLFPGGYASGRLKCPQTGPFAAVTLSPSDSGQKEATFTREEGAECPSKPAAGHCPPPWVSQAPG